MPELGLEHRAVDRGRVDVTLKYGLNGLLMATGLDDMAEIGTVQAALRQFIPDEIVPGMRMELVVAPDRVSEIGKLQNASCAPYDDIGEVARAPLITVASHHGSGQQSHPGWPDIRFLHVRQTADPGQMDFATVECGFPPMPGHPIHEFNFNPSRLLHEANDITHEVVRIGCLTGTEKESRHQIKT